MELKAKLIEKCKIVHFSFEGIEISDNINKSTKYPLIVSFRGEKPAIDLELKLIDHQSAFFSGFATSVCAVIDIPMVVYL